MGHSKLKVFVILFSIAAVFLLLAGFSEEHKSDRSLELNTPPDVTAVPVQLGRDSYGLAMIDNESQTLWVYGFDTRGKTFETLHLIAARSFEYDRKLTEWNTGTPTPTQVKNILDTLESQRQQKQESKIEELQQVLEQE